MSEIVIASANPGKVREFMEILSPWGIVVLSLEDFPLIAPPEEDGSTFLENAAIKAVHYSKITKAACIADDSGLVVDAIHGSPGICSSRYAGEGATDGENIDRLLVELAGHTRPWSARFVCSAVFSTGGKVLADSLGTLDGEIIPEKRGNFGFGYDPVFLLPELGKTVAEIRREEKNLISHRRKAIQNLIEELREMGEI